MTQTATIGAIDSARQIATYRHDGVDYVDGCEQIGRGSHRAVYLDHNQDTVYKVGFDAANRREHRILTDARLAGAEHAPVTALYEVTVDDGWGDQVTCTVVAMPYLPEDGSLEHDGVIFWEAGDLNPTNVTANGGQLWLIDAGGLW